MLLRQSHSRLPIISALAFVTVAPSGRSTRTAIIIVEPFDVILGQRRARLDLDEHKVHCARVRHPMCLAAANTRDLADPVETMGTISYSHIFSSNVVGDLHGMVRDTSSDLDSNPFSTPIIAFQHNWFREGYFKGTISIHRGNQEWKAGVESDEICRAKF